MGMFDSIDPSLTGENDNYQESGFTKAVNAMPVYDKVALGTAPIPVVGDITGLFADAAMYYNDPESRTWDNFLLTALGLLPFVPGAATKRGWEKLANNMDNARDWFYSGIPGAQLAEMAKIPVEAVLARRWQDINPAKRALWENQGISEMTYKKVQKHLGNAKKLEDKIQAAQNYKGNRIPPEWDIELNGGQLMESSGADGWQHLLTGNVDDVREKYIAKLKKQQVQEMQKLEGQKAQTMLFNKQYDNPNASILGEQAARDYVGQGKMTYTDMSNMFKDYDLGMNPKEFQELYSGVMDAQKVVGDGSETIMVMKRNRASTASGNLAHEMSSTQKYSPNLHAFKKAMQNQPLAQSFRSVGEMIGEVKSGLGAKPSKVAVKRFTENSKILTDLIKQNPELLKAQNFEQFMKGAENMKIVSPKGRKVAHNINETFVKDMFKMRQKQPFRNNKEMIAAIEANGGRVKNKTEALKGAPVRLADSHKSGAWELGGVNMQTVVRTDGTGFSLINDKNDIGRFNAPKSKDIITVSEPYVQNFGNIPQYGQRKQAREAVAAKANYARKKDAAALTEQLGVNPEGMLPPHAMSQLAPYQQATTRAIETAYEAPNMSQIAKSALNYAYDTSVNVGRMANRDYEEQ